MPKYRLHYFPESGNSYKLALMLTLCGESFEPVWTDFAGGVTRTPEWRRDVNEMGEIPVLEVDGERRTQTHESFRRHRRIRNNAKQIRHQREFRSYL